MYVLLIMLKTACVWGEKIIIGPFQAWRLIISMVLVRLDTVPLAIHHLKLALMDLQGAVGALWLIRKGMYFSTLERRSCTEQYGAEGW